ncbi:hypothetical protein E6W36_16010 [Hankyongella ginsenosidimutans]|uniref:Blue (type 1) copper domain-containing protein n=1 Tax=Hankyongella ginsenosidimutans TaxID=1763828 RepID=A0A4D7C0T4_9SPHN|nr:hypothetical protein [Hankyongella ginsenosidimutans]QCI78641.1 hypothetical protein E6W36_00345 [Hankyongella ginsenosidimutans]QCI80469.1 hypothetical protein E6W36_16010 [Hankyongella ginsenosidimutans]
MAIAAAGLAPAVVSQSNKMFSVANLQVKIGQKIIFKNDDNVPHNIYSLVNGSKIDAGLKNLEKTQRYLSINLVIFELGAPFIRK